MDARTPMAYKHFINRSILDCNEFPHGGRYANKNWQSNWLEYDKDDKEKEKRREIHLEEWFSEENRFGEGKVQWIHSNWMSGGKETKIEFLRNHSAWFVD